MPALPIEGPNRITLELSGRLLVAQQRRSRTSGRWSLQREKATRLSHSIYYRNRRSRREFARDDDDYRSRELKWTLIGQVNPIWRSCAKRRR